MFDFTTHLTTLINTPKRGGELVIRGDEIPADPAAAADFCAEQDEALHERGFMRTSPWSCRSSAPPWAPCVVTFATHRPSLDPTAFPRA